MTVKLIRNREFVCGGRLVGMCIFGAYVGVNVCVFKCACVFQASTHAIPNRNNSLSLDDL